MTGRQGGGCGAAGQSVPGTLISVFGVEPGDHAWVGYAGEDERRALWAAHATAAVERGERAVFIDGGGWAPAATGGQVAVQDPAEAGFVGGRLEAALLTDALARQSDEAARLGLRGLRVCVDLSDVLRPDERECPVAAASAGRWRPPAVICHGDRERLPGAGARRGHDLALDADPAVRRGPLLCMKPGADGLRLVGELDRTNLDRFRAALETAADAAGRDGRDLRLHVQGLRHVDVDAVRLLVRTADALPDGRRLVLRSPGAVLRAVLQSFAWDGRVVTEEGDGR